MWLRNASRLLLQFDSKTVSFVYTVLCPNVCNSIFHVYSPSRSSLALFEFEPESGPIRLCWNSFPLVSFNWKVYFESAFDFWTLSQKLSHLLCIDAWKIISEVKRKLTLRYVLPVCKGKDDGVQKEKRGSAFPVQTTNEAHTNERPFWVKIQNRASISIRPVSNLFLGNTKEIIILEKKHFKPFLYWNPRVNGWGNVPIHFVQIVSFEVRISYSLLHGCYRVSMLFYAYAYTWPLKALQMLIPPRKQNCMSSILLAIPPKYWRTQSVRILH